MSHQTTAQPFRRPTSTATSRPTASTTAAQTAHGGHTSLADQPWVRDLTLVSLGMGAGMGVESLGAMLASSPFLVVPALVYVAFWMAAHLPIGILSGVAVRAGIRWAQPRMSARAGLVALAAIGAMTGLVGELALHTVVGGPSALSHYLFWAASWGLAASVAVPVASVGRKEGTAVSWPLFFVGLTMAAVFQLLG